MINKRVRLFSFVLTLIMILGFTSMSFASYPTPGEMGKDVINSLKDVGREVVTGVVDTATKLISQLFSDIKESDWYASTVKKLVDLGGINGYPDGSFKPNNQITRAEFTKILVSALGHEDLRPTSSHWGSGYVDKAVELNLITKGEMINLNGVISRKEMAKMVANSLDYKGESHVTNRSEYKSQIKDYSKINRNYQDYVLKAYTKGIITGYPDGTFGGDRGLTRAEASTVIMRVIDESERKLPPEPNADTTFVEPELFVHYFDGKYDYEHFYIGVKNSKDYQGAVPHTFVTECISHPNINLIYSQDIYGKFMNKKIDEIEQQKKTSPKFSGGNGIYALGMKNSWKPVEGTFNIKDGGLMKYKITVSNGTTTKEYTIDVKFNDRVFNLGGMIL